MNCKHKIVFAFLILTMFSSCDSIFNRSNSIDGRTTFSEKRLKYASNSIPEKYAVLILSDIHFGSSSKSRIEKILNLAKTNNFPTEEKILFCAILGDIAETGKVEEYLDFKNFKTDIENCGIEVFSVPGNHDFYETGNKGENYLKYVSQDTFFRLKIENTSYYFLDTANETLGFNQLNILEREFGYDNNKKIIFTHYPFFSESIVDKMLNFNERAKLTSLLASANTVYYFCGHTHSWEIHDFKNFTEIVASSLKNESDSKSGYVILTVDNVNNSFNYAIHYLD